MVYLAELYIPGLLRDKAARNDGSARCHGLSLRTAAVKQTREYISRGDPEKI